MNNRSVIKFKIHGTASVIGSARSANNNVFYDTFEEAHAKCLEYMRKSDAPVDGFVIMTTCAIIRPVHAPVETMLVRDNGSIELMD